MPQSSVAGSSPNPGVGVGELVGAADHRQPEPLRRLAAGQAVPAGNAGHQPVADDGGDLRPGAEVLAAAPVPAAERVLVGAGARDPLGPGAVPTHAARAYVLGIEHLRREADMRRFDLEVEGSHTYLVDGVAVHNSPETTPGGRALKFYSSVRLDIRRIETLKEGSEAVGNRVRVKVVKNKVAPPFRQAEFDIIYGEGISHEGNLIDLGLEQGLVQKSGAYFSYGDERLGQGRNAARAFLREHPDVAAELEARIREAAGVPGDPPPPVEAEAEAQDALAGSGATPA